jgi:hypothetical protein
VFYKYHAEAACRAVGSVGPIHRSTPTGAVGMIGPLPPPPSPSSPLCDLSVEALFRRAGWPAGPPAPHPDRQSDDTGQQRGSAHPRPYLLRARRASIGTANRRQISVNRRSEPWRENHDAEMVRSDRGRWRGPLMVATAGARAPEAGAGARVRARRTPTRACQSAGA